ncbi:MAG: hypothetical protein ABI472_20105 [Ginsengibacter sp.]
MRYLECSILLLITIHFSFGQGVERSYNESAVQFATRMMPEHSQVAFHVLETRWNDQPVIIAFYNQDYQLSKQDDPGQQNYVRLIGEIFFTTHDNHYNRFIIDTIESEGGDPTIYDVFFANADKGKNKELILLVSWSQVHADVKGTLYATYVYDDWGKTAEKKIRYLKSISEKLSGGCDCVYENGTHTQAKFTTPAEIISALRRPGYKR